MAEHLVILVYALKCVSVFKNFSTVIAEPSHTRLQLLLDLA